MRPWYVLMVFWIDKYAKVYSMILSYPSLQARKNVPVRKKALYQSINVLHWNVMIVAQ